ncbi:penicillin-insensitive murein endopeptidase [Pseudoxanthobacter sp. M-2]|uniref:penicillin-insensitive murein endopeptidase n=1 Tax=Pseudoxanthobacter sp. M-2 TaxID=3078754 RepID=UPI0038FD34E8
MGRTPIRAPLLAALAALLAAPLAGPVATAAVPLPPVRPPPSWIGPGPGTAAPATPAPPAAAAPSEDGPAQAAAPARAAPSADAADALPAAPAAPSTGGRPRFTIPVTASAPAKELFGNVGVPAPLAARAIGFYSRGCLAGAKALPVDGKTWQVMRLSRNRNWGHPALIAYLEKLAAAAPGLGWRGLLVGDLAQPRGGPMLTGHASHQIGLDADIWLTPMPNRTLSTKEREDLSAQSMLKENGVEVDPKLWTAAHARLIRRAALDREVERIFVHPAIKQALCTSAGSDRAWLSKVRPYWGHHYHFHVRLDCPPGSEGCRPQDPPGSGDGCGSEVKEWLAKVRPRPQPATPAKPAKPKPPLPLSALPAECRTVLLAE